MPYRVEPAVLTHARFWVSTLDDWSVAEDAGWEMHGFDRVYMEYAAEQCEAYYPDLETFDYEDAFEWEIWPAAVSQVRWEAKGYSPDDAAAAAALEPLQDSYPWTMWPRRPRN